MKLHFPGICLDYSQGPSLINQFKASSNSYLYHECLRLFVICNHTGYFLESEVYFQIPGILTTTTEDKKSNGRQHNEFEFQDMYT